MTDVQVEPLAQSKLQNVTNVYFLQIAQSQASQLLCPNSNTKTQKKKSFSISINQRSDLTTLPVLLGRLNIDLP
jgi:hypothetical protein